MAEIIYDQADVSVTAGNEGSTVVFTSTPEEPRTLLAVSCNNVTATIDMLIYDEREKIADVPLDIKPLADKWLDIPRIINSGNQLKVGHRNGTGGTVSVAFSIKSEIG